LAFEEAALAGKAKFVRTLWLETRSGQRAATHTGLKYMRLGAPRMGPPASAPAGTPTNPSRTDAFAPKEGKPAENPPAPPIEGWQSVEHLTENVGASFELEPVIAPDGTVDLNVSLDYDYAPPVQRHPQSVPKDDVFRPAPPATDFHQANLSTSIMLLSGTSQLLGVWQPEGAPEFKAGDVLQAAFISVDVIEVGEGKKK
jgi:hypothetical protein